MLSKIQIFNFKSHKDTKIDVKNLLVLCGLNGYGKSSIIQMLLLLRDAFIKDNSCDFLDLKSNSVKIGTVNDAIYEYGDFDGFMINLKFNDGAFLEFYYEAFSEDEKSKSYIKLNKSKSKVNINSSFSLFNLNFQYISSARQGPLEQYPKDDKIVDVQKQISVNEGKAEYFVHFLDKFRNLDVIKELCITNYNNDYTDLYSQVQLWEKYIFDGANTHIKDMGKLGFTLQYSFDNEESSTKKTKNFDAKNVGFGLTYSLPIIVAILAAQKSSIIIIENPEAHLHPSGISRITELICKAAQAGIQIIIETHSDHILNGILVQSKLFEDSNSNNGIDRNNIKIYQIDRDDKYHCSIGIPINIEEGGRIYQKPENFFDQLTTDLRQLF